MKHTGIGRRNRFQASLLASEALARANAAIHAGSPGVAAKISHVQSADAGVGRPLFQEINANATFAYAGG